MVTVYTPLTWGLHSGPPPDIPECGFLGELCRPPIQGELKCLHTCYRCFFRVACSHKCFDYCFIFRFGTEAYKSNRCHPVSTVDKDFGPLPPIGYSVCSCRQTFYCWTSRFSSRWCMYMERFTFRHYLLTVSADI